MKHKHCEICNGHNVEYKSHSVACMPLMYLCQLCMCKMESIMMRSYVEMYWTKFEQLDVWNRLGINND
jgi:hypothetical protein